MTGRQYSSYVTARRAGPWSVVALSVLGICFRFGTSALAGPVGFALTRDGRPVATIVLAKEPTAAAEFAAAELKYHIRKITGATLPVVTDETPVTGSRILVGESAATRALGLRSESFKPLERLVCFSGTTLILMGRDESRATSASSKSNPTWVPGKFGHGFRFDGQHNFIAVAASTRTRRVRSFHDYTLSEGGGCTASVRRSFLSIL